MAENTRKDPRAKVLSMTVRYRSATLGEFIEHHSYDVSRGGMFIKTPAPFPPGTLLKFEVKIAEEQRVMQGVGRVVWKRDQPVPGTDEPAGMGIKFIKIDDASRAVIERLIEQRGSMIPGAFDMAPGAPSSGDAPMFPSTGGTEAAPEDRTVMRPAAELLDEALKKTGEESAPLSARAAPASSRGPASSRAVSTVGADAEPAASTQVTPGPAPLAASPAFETEPPPPASTRAKAGSEAALLSTQRSDVGKLRESIPQSAGATTTSGPVPAQAVEDEEGGGGRAFLLLLVAAAVAFGIFILTKRGQETPPEPEPAAAPAPLPTPLATSPVGEPSALPAEPTSPEPAPTDATGTGAAPGDAATSPGPTTSAATGGSVSAPPGSAPTATSSAEVAPVTPPVVKKKKPVTPPAETTGTTSSTSPAPAPASPPSAPTPPAENPY